MVWSTRLTLLGMADKAYATTDDSLQLFSISA
jgi:hypothetical protein